VDGPALLHTARLVLQPLEGADVDELFALASDPAISRFDLVLLHNDRSQTTRWVQRAAEDRQRCGLAPWALRLRGVGEPAAADVRSDLPVVAATLQGGAPSLRAAERAGLQRVWAGLEAHGPDPEAVLLLLTDHPVGHGPIAALSRV
jgi:hypothetical protein